MDRGFGGGEQSRGRGGLGQPIEEEGRDVLVPEGSLGPGRSRVRLAGVWANCVRPEPPTVRPLGLRGTGGGLCRAEQRLAEPMGAERAGGWASPRDRGATPAGKAGVGAV